MKPRDPAAPPSHAEFAVHQHGEAIGRERRRVVADNTVFHERGRESRVVLPIIPIETIEIGGSLPVGRLTGALCLASMPLCRARPAPSTPEEAAHVHCGIGSSGG
jgi:hypothetical protein